MQIINGIKLDDDVNFHDLGWSIPIIGKRGYAVVRLERKRGIPRYLHRLLLDAPAHMLVDHKNGDPTDNRRENLRLCTRSQNAFNTGLRKNNKFGVTGVSFCPSRRCKNVWKAQGRAGTACLNKSFLCPVEAVAARIQWAKQHHGEFFRL